MASDTCSSDSSGPCQRRVIPIGRSRGREHRARRLPLEHSQHRPFEWRRRPISHGRRNGSPLARDGCADLSSQQHQDLTWAAYTDIPLRKYFAGRVVFIGDAAHSISPRLGQGANLGLVDALVLSRCVTMHSDLGDALRRYNVERARHVRFYHSASKWLSLLFQSDSVVAPAIRDLAFLPMSRIPHFRRQMLESLSGVKTGLFSSIELSTLHEAYGLPE